jgi:hypothetical protein
MFKKLGYFILDWFILKFAMYLKRWIEKQARDKKSEKKHRENAEVLKKAKTEEEKREALDRLVDDFD